MSDEVVGKSAGWSGPAEQYVRNEGSVGDRRIVFVGASYKFCHKVLRDMLLVGGFEDVHLVVHDIDDVPLNIVADLLEKIARQKNTNIKVSRTLDRAEALRGADAVILSITVGGRESDFRSFEVCHKYGIPVGIGDTMGPAALARNLRAVPVVLEIARDMERLCPEAVLLNFTNPMSVLTGAINQHTAVPCWGLCHSGDELLGYFARVFGVSKRDVRIEIGGVNHQSFVTRLWIDGRERSGDLLEATQASGAKLADTLPATRDESVRLQQDICRVLGAWPSTGHTHLAEFYRFFFAPRRAAELGLAEELKQIMPDRKPFGRRACPEIIDEWTYGPDPVGDLHILTTEHAHELLWSVFTGEPFERVLNVPNTDGLLVGIPPTACVEALVTVAGRSVTGTPVDLPAAVKSLVHRWSTIHALSLRAATEYDRDAARQALFLDPHVGDLYDIAPLLEDMLSALRPWLPAAWFEVSNGSRSLPDRPPTPHRGELA